MLCTVLGTGDIVMSNSAPHKYLLSPYYVSGTPLGLKDVAVASQNYHSVCIVREPSEAKPFVHFTLEEIMV